MCYVPKLIQQNRVGESRGGRVKWSFGNTKVLNFLDKVLNILKHFHLLDRNCTLSNYWQ